MQKPSHIGGQAVLEGIMMRNQGKYAIAVRKPDNEIEVKVSDYKPTIPGKSIEKIPVLRGVSAFIDSLVVGISCLTYSASFFDDEEEEGEQKPKREKTQAEIKKEEKKEKAVMGITVAIAIVFSVVLFIILPYALASISRRAGASEAGVAVLEALLRIGIFLLYMVLISRMKDIQRVFMYHGSEHKCINCIEHGKELNVGNVMKSSRLHKRCGTSFMLFVIIISVIFFLIVSALGITSPLWRFLIRIIFIPVIAGISYEFLRWAGNSDSKIVDIISKPGLQMQKLVTKEPTGDQVEVAIAAVEAVFDWRAFLKENFPSSGYGDDEL